MDEPLALGTGSLAEDGSSILFVRVVGCQVVEVHLLVGHFLLASLRQTRLSSDSVLGSILSESPLLCPLPRQRGAPLCWVLTDPTDPLGTLRHSRISFLNMRINIKTVKEEKLDVEADASATVSPPLRPS